MTPLVFLGVESSEQQMGTSRLNRAEAAVAAGAARKLLPHLPQGELAIITPCASHLVHSPHIVLARGCGLGLARGCGEAKGPLARGCARGSHGIGSQVRSASQRVA